MLSNKVFKSLRMKVFSVIFIFAYTMNYCYAQSTNDSTKTEIEIPEWFLKIDSLDVSKLSGKSVQTLFDTINYKILGTEQIAILESKKQNLKSRYIAEHGEFPMIYPQATLVVSNMYCSKCVKMVTKILEIEASVIQVLKADTLNKLITITYDSSLKGKEDEKLYPILKSKLAQYNYIAMSEDESNDPAQLENANQFVLYCPIHNKSAVEAEDNIEEIQEE